MLGSKSHLRCFFVLEQKNLTLRKFGAARLLITLGHTNVKTTQFYARITDTKVCNDMDVLQENLQGVFDKPLAQSIKSRKKIAQAAF